MSIVISNQNRVIRSTVVTPPVTGASRVFVTLPSMPVNGRVLSVRAAASAAVASWAVTLLTSGGEYRAYEAANDTVEQNKRVIDKMTSAAGAASTASIIAPFGGSPVLDETGTGCLHLILGTKDGSDFPDGITFTVTADVQPMLYLPEKTAFSGNNTYRVLRKSGTGVTDLTQKALRNGNPYLQAGIDQSEKFTLFSANTDEVYIGLDAPFAGAFFSIPQAESFKQGVRWDISTGTSTWSAVAANNLFDNTSEGHPTTPSGLSYTGAVKVKLPQASWTAYKLASDPMTVEEAAIAAGNAPYRNLNNPPRYWLRLRPASGATFSSTLEVTGIQPLAA